MSKSKALGYEVKMDYSGLDALWKRLQDLNQKEIEYGFINEEKYPAGDKRAGMYVADIAWKQEQGFETTGEPAPPRPFFTQSITDAKSYVSGVAPVIFKLSLIGKVEKEMLNIGKGLVQTVRTSIDDAQFPLNRERTLDLKAPETRVLHETGLMYDSITARIVNRDAYGQRKKEVDIK